MHTEAEEALQYAAVFALSFASAVSCLSNTAILPYVAFYVTDIHAAPDLAHAGQVFACAVDSLSTRGDRSFLACRSQD